MSRLTIALLVLAASVRLVLLDWKPVHYDEGNNGYFVNQLWLKGFAAYDPANYHGPLYFYYLHLAEIVLGRGIVAFRFATALLSAATVYLAALHARYLGRAAYWAALILAVSPAFVFYGRYAIHESMLILFQVCFSYGFFAWHYERSRRGWVAMATGIVGSLATKETFFIFFGTWFIALALTRLLEPRLPARPATSEPAGTTAHGPGAFWRLAVAVGGAVAAGGLYSGFLLAPSGAADLFTALTAWTKTGTGQSAHAKPFAYWLELLAAYEWPMLFALAFGSIASLFGSTWMRLFSATGFGLWLAYSLIPYKTPWLIIGFWPLAFSAGFLAIELPRQRLRQAAHAILVGGLVVSAATMMRLNFFRYEDPAEQYVYVQSRSDLNVVLDVIDRRTRIAPEDQAMPIRVWVRDTWPLPWLLSLYPDVAFGTFAPGMYVDGAVVLLDGSEQRAFESALRTPYLRIPFQLRDAYPAGFAYFEQARFAGLVPDGAELVGAAAP